MKRIGYAGLVAVLIAGCAASPESIKPIQVSEAIYEHHSCDQMVSEQTRIVFGLIPATDAQRSARNTDTMGVLLFGLPLSSMSGNNQKSEIARLKGELKALQKAAELKGCRLPEVPKDGIQPSQTAGQTTTPPR